MPEIKSDISEEILKSYFEELLKTIRDRDVIVKELYADLDRRTDALYLRMNNRFEADVDTHREHIKYLYTKFERLVWFGLGVVGIVAAIVGFQTIWFLPAKINSAISEIAKVEKNAITAEHMKVLESQRDLSKYLEKVKTEAGGSLNKFNTNLDKNLEIIKGEATTKVDNTTVAYEDKLRNLVVDTQLDMLGGPSDRNGRNFTTLIEAFEQVDEQRKIGILEKMPILQLESADSQRFLRAIKKAPPETDLGKRMAIFTRMRLGDKSAVIEVTSQLQSAVKSNPALVPEILGGLNRAVERGPQINAPSINKELYRILEQPGLSVETYRETLLLLSRLANTESDAATMNALAKYVKIMLPNPDLLTKLDSLTQNIYGAYPELLNGMLEFIEKYRQSNIKASAQMASIAGYLMIDNWLDYERIKWNFSQIADKILPLINSNDLKTSLKLLVDFLDGTQVRLTSNAKVSEIVREIRSRAKTGDIKPEEDTFKAKNTVFKITKLAVEGGDYDAPNVVLIISGPASREQMAINQKIEFKIPLLYWGISPSISSQPVHFGDVKLKFAILRSDFLELRVKTVD